MVEYLLVMAFFAGTMMSSASGVSVSSISSFTTDAECQAAGAKIQKAFEDRAKSAGFVCVEHKKP